MQSGLARIIKKGTAVLGHSLFSLPLLGLSLMLGGLPTTSAEAADVTVIHAGKLLAVPGQAPISPATLVIEDGKVKEVRAGHVDAAALGLGADAKIIDLSDKFVMPGFIDLHVHLSFGANPDRTLIVTKPDSYFSLIAANNARKTLMTGFTTVRDLGSPGTSVYALRDGIRDGLVPGPKILVAGAAITPTGGHGDFHGYRDEVEKAMPAAGVCNGADDCRRAVRAAVKRGSDVIKVTSTGGTLSNTAAGTGQQFTDAELVAIAETAHALGRKVTAHAHDKAGIDSALRAGFDSIEHSMWADEDTLRLFKKTGAWLIPTIYPITYAGDTPEKMRNGPYKNATPAVMAKLLKLGRQPKDMASKAYKMGVNIALGTDSGVSPNGENINEFIELVGIGMTPMEALMAGTVKAAQAGGIEGVGKLAPGMAADVVAMPGDPLQDIKAVLGVDFVMRDGIVFKQDGK
ncbi:metal-dependent hydrolase family protein [Govanella unica]|uniref:Amidohydrolase family protein n=1 Tax=Govanella unica TaxID=2975056 RepID=A0A9X3TZB6_9PROT|nr:amidohydrolase family protein [Govania unica]MDA5194546.1 amidohydrolase family protein [Govania unica]